MNQQQKEKMGIRIAELVREAIVEFLSVIDSPAKLREGKWRDDDKKVVQMAMHWHLVCALQFLEAILMLRGSILIPPAAALFRSISEVVYRGRWIFRYEEHRAARALSYIEYVEAMLLEYWAGISESEKPKPRKIRDCVKTRYGQNACTIGMFDMLKNIGLEDRYAQHFMVPSAAVHGAPSLFEDVSLPPHGAVVAMIGDAGELAFDLARDTASAYGMTEKFNSIFKAVIEAKNRVAAGN